MSQLLNEKIGRGRLTLPLAHGKFFTVWGGPFEDRPANLHGVKMQPENEARFNPDRYPGQFTVMVPTQDFNVPSYPLMVQGIDETVRLILARERVYVGCMAGKGRTGLFMSCLVKTFGIKNPVEYVRWDYFNHAVETQDQRYFVDDFEPAQSTVDAIQQAKRDTRNPLHASFWIRESLTR